MPRFGRKGSNDTPESELPNEEVTSEGATPASATEPEFDDSSRIGRLQNRLNSFDRSKRYDATDLMLAWDGSAERREQLRRKALAPSTLSKVGAGLLAGVSVLMIGSSAMGGSDHDKKISDYNAQIDKLNQELEVATDKAKKVPSAKDGTLMLKQADAVGRQIADGENKLKVATGQSKFDQISDLYKNNAKLATEGNADGVGMWYYIDTATSNKFRNTKYSWTYQPAYTFIEDGTKIPMIWLCKDESNGDVLSWATGTYNIADKKLESTMWGNTTKGNEKIGASLK